ncbi:MAG: hypothetical protein QG625_2116, partial [Cyanobacteriota bacterium erpe_2018_sw_39hr_WHONDRS-SW48-000098_B_bin.30]|nr:hypothetical protein [Cyanobacteriota bacterium erpe_2018_sw_39hr_WHONDRS-SW48-000098_B_bin.30]
EWYVLLLIVAMNSSVSIVSITGFEGFLCGASLYRCAT